MASSSNLLVRFIFVAQAFICLPMLASAQCSITVDAGDDIYLCAPPSPTELNGSISGDYLSFMWTPTTGMTGSNTLSPTVNVTQTTSYVLTATAADLNNNLVINGDFEGGNFGFSSDYGYSPGDLVPEGLYDVIDNPQADHSGFAACDDHTTGAGNMMVVNGAGTPNQNVWCQTVAVNPNSQYVLSAWVTSVVGASPALLQFSINGSTLGPIFNAPSQVCNWQNYYQIWNSGGNTSATICIVNQNTTLGGNDFALDDIVFSPVCTVRDTVVVSVINVTAAAFPSIVTIPCEGANVTLNGTGSSTGPNITYAWDTPDGNIVSGGATLMPVVNQPGSYTLTVSYTAPDGTVCEKLANVNVVLAPNQLAAWITPPQPLGCGSATTTLIGNSSQPGFSTYAWSTQDGNIVSGEFQKLCIVDMVGTYSLTVTNTNTGCTATSEVSVIATTTPPIANATVSDTLTCFQDTVQLLSTGSSTGPNITYSWTTANGHILSGHNSQTALADTVGIYVLNVTNTTNNCTARDTVKVIGNLTPPYMFLPPQQQITCDIDTITMIVYLYPPPFVWINWTASNGGHIVSGEQTPNPTVDAQGNYHVTVQDPINGCISTGSVFVVNNIHYPDAQIVPPGQITCQSPSINLSGNGSSTGPSFGYSWTASNGGNIVSGEFTLNPLVNSAGDYTLTVLDSTNGCFSTVSTGVSADTNVVTVIANAPDTLTCAISNVVLNANGSSSGTGITYLWTTTDGHISMGFNTPNPTVDLPGTYQLLLTNTANGCAGTDLAVVQINTAVPDLSIQPPGQLTCISPTQTLYGVNNSLPGNFTYHWTASSGGNILSGDSTLTLLVNAQGNYTLTATNLATGCTGSMSAWVSLAAGTPAAVASVPGPLTCAQQAQTLSSAGSSVGSNYSYQWSAFNGGNISGNTNNPTATANTPGSYVLAVTNSVNGCVTYDTIVVSQNIVAPPADAGLPDTITCASPNVQLTANGPTPDPALIYNWAGGTFVGSSNQSQVSVSSADTYFVTVTDPANGCSTVDSVLVSADQAVPQLSQTPTVPLTCSTLLQTIQVQNNSLPGNFAYSWTTSGTGNITGGVNALIPNVNAPGTYVLSVVNLDNGCTSTLSATVTQDTAAPVLAIAAPGEITCTNPTQILQGQNLSLPGNFSYSWTPAAGGTILSGATTLNPEAGTGGNYQLLVTNLDNACTSTASVQVVQNNQPPLANAGVDATLTCNLNSLPLAGAGSGAATLQYNWTASGGGHILSGNGTTMPIIDAPGIYTLTVTNTGNGCTATDAVEIFNDANAPNVDAGVASTLTCALTQTMLNANASTGSNFTYQWTATNGGLISSGPTTLTPTIDNPGIYTLVVTNTNNGCTRSSSVTVLEDVIPPVVNAGAPATLTCAVTSLNLAATSTGGAATYNWQTTGGNIVSGGSSLTPLVNLPGTYTFTSTLTSNGCSASAQTQVGIDTISPAFSLQTPLLLTCATLSTPLTGVVQQPAAGNYTALWSTGNGHFTGSQQTLATSADQPGIYILQIQNTANGCSATRQVTVSQNITPPAALAAPGGEITCASPSIQLNGAGSATGAGISYTWTASGGGTIVSGGNTLNPVVGSAGAYTLQVTNAANGCTATAQTTVANNTTPPVALVAAPGQLTCAQTSVVLNGSASSGGVNFSASWATSGGHIVLGQNTLNPTVDEPGNYLLTVQNVLNGCVSTTQVLVTENTTPPAAEAGNGGELHCNQPQLTLLGSSSTPGAMQFAWSTQNGHVVSGANSAAGVVDEPGLYTLTVTNPANGCTAMDATSVSQLPLPAFAPTVDQPDCHVRTGTVAFGQVSGGQGPFSYSTDGGQTFSGQHTVGDLTPGNYTLVVEDAYGCTVSESATVDAPFIPTLTLVSVETIEIGDSVLLQPTTNIAPNNVSSWSWTPAEGLSCADCSSPWAKPFRSINYVLEVEDKNGCSAQAPVQVRVDRRRNIYAPNVFSPNDDGQNDWFMIFGKGVREIQSLQVYDRWGTELWRGEGLEIGDEPSGWNGAYRGSPMAPAVFVWWAKIEFIDGQVELFKGDVTLVR
ncbi:MAG: PKD domain-containing protein [Saprospiraceae bacterium]|nr:PKD domain-containing protein [Saprospiraceae bacterium]